MGEVNFTDNLTDRGISPPEELVDIPTEGNCFGRHFSDTRTFHQSLQFLVYFLVK